MIEARVTAELSYGVFFIVFESKKQNEKYESLTRFALISRHKYTYVST